MKPISRIGIFFIILASSLFLVTIYRSSPVGLSSSTHLSPDTWTETESFLWSPKDVRIMFSTTDNQEVSLYLLDAQGLNDWQTTGKLHPLLSFENTSNGIYTYSIPARGRYSFIILSQNETFIEIDLTLYGFENDLIVAVEALTIFGLTLTVASFIIEKPAFRRFIKNHSSERKTVSFVDAFVYSHAYRSSCCFIRFVNLRNISSPRGLSRSGRFGSSSKTDSLCCFNRNFAQ
jgi:hypothetical protein